MWPHYNAYKVNYLCPAMENTQLTTGTTRPQCSPWAFCAMIKKKGGGKGSLRY